jgi:hypothetical protein
MMALRKKEDVNMIRPMKKGFLVLMLAACFGSGCALKKQPVPEASLPSSAYLSSGGATPAGPPGNGPGAFGSPPGLPYGAPQGSAGTAWAGSLPAPNGPSISGQPNPPGGVVPPSANQTVAVPPAPPSKFQKFGAWMKAACARPSESNPPKDSDDKPHAVYAD